MPSGYGSQALALKYLGVEFEHWKICEWAVKSIQAYKDIHFTDDDTDYFNQQCFKDDWLISWLHEKGISNNYNEPMTKEQIIRLGEDKRRTIYNNICTTNNLVNIQQVKGKDLDIVDTDKYDYILTYSFPCQDLSLAGKRAGMNDTSTRSGMLWEVERILDECKQLGELPQILLMENVPQVHGSDNVDDFNKWQLKLEQLGYKNYWQDLIATDYGIPQTRNRTFMISILGDYNYTFPKPIPLKLKLKDMLEDIVDESYYLSDKQIIDIQNWNSYEKPLENMEKIDKENISPTLTTRSGAYAAGMVLVKDTENYVEWKEKGKLDSDCRAAKEEKVSLTLTTSPKAKVLIKNEMELKKELCNKLIKNRLVEEGDVIKHSYTQQILDGNKKCVEKNDGNMITLTTRCDCLGVVNNLRIRKLTPKECFRLMGVKDEDYENCAINQSNASLYHLAGDSIVVNVLMAIFKNLF